jgi:hypothetical protein
MSRFRADGWKFKSLGSPYNGKSVCLVTLAYPAISAVAGPGLGWFITAAKPRPISDRLAMAAYYHAVGRWRIDPG